MAGFDFRESEGSSLYDSPSLSFPGGSGGLGGDTWIGSSPDDRAEDTNNGSNQAEPAQSGSQTGSQPVTPATPDPLGPSPLAFVNSFEKSPWASKPYTYTFKTGAQVSVNPSKSGEPFIASYEASTEGTSANPSANNVSNSIQNAETPGDIESQRRQWEFDKGIDSSLKKGRTWPSNGKINSDYELERPHPTHKGVIKPHRALDIKNSYGGQVVSAGDGTIQSIGNSGDLGNHVIINYDNGYRGVYGHTASSLKPGQQVRSGAPIGNTDLSGATTGPHIHYEVHDQKTGHKLNPRDHLPMRLE